MDWYFETLGGRNPLLQPRGMNCEACTVQKPLQRDESEFSKKNGKCCRFTPFWSAFAAGHWSLNQPKPQFIAPPIYTKLGVLHSLSARLNSDSLCHLYDQHLHQCQVWKDRPPTCATFYCCHPNRAFKKKMTDIEDDWLAAEAQLLREWSMEIELPLEAWESWCDHMEPEPITTDLHPELLIYGEDQAWNLYKDSYTWLKKQFGD